jgi:hypothetical protein
VRVRIVSRCGTESRMTYMPTASRSRTTIGFKSSSWAAATALATRHVPVRLVMRSPSTGMPSDP